MNKQLTFPQLQILIDRHLGIDTQQFQPNFLNDIKVLKELELLDRQSNITPFGTSIIKGVQLKLRLIEEQSSIFKGNPYKGEDNPEVKVIPIRSGEQRVEERSAHHD